MPRIVDVRSQPSTQAVVVLGCTVVLDRAGRLAAGALSRRIASAARAWRAAAADGSGPVCVASGGRHWAGRVEADVMARELEGHGVAARAILRERCSLTTADNARFSAALLERMGIARIRLVTCEWHMRRAVGLFAEAGLDVDPLGVGEPRPASWRRRWWRAMREEAWSWAYAWSSGSPRPRDAAGRGASAGRILPAGRP